MVQTLFGLYFLGLNQFQLTQRRRAIKRAFVGLMQFFENNQLKGVIHNRKLLDKILVKMFTINFNSKHFSKPGF